MALSALTERRSQLIADARRIADEAGDADLTGDQREHYDRLITEATSLGERIQREHTLVEQERDAARAVLEHRGDPGGAAPPEVRTADDEREQRTAAFRSWMGDLETRGQYQFRALQADSGTAGGYLVQEEQFVSELIEAVRNQVFMRQFATVRSVTNARSLGVPTLETLPDDANWTSELAIGNEDSSMAFGKRELWPRPLAKYIKISKDLLRFSPNAEGIVRDALAYKFGVAMESAYLTGSGANEPLGVFTASTQGISTGRDVSTGNSSTSIQWDGLFEAKYSIKGQYWPRLRWVFHRDAVKQIAKLKDGDGQYVWEPSVQAGQPDRILSFPVTVSEYAPNTFTTQLYVGILGDFSNYWIADAMDLELQRLIELYAGTNQIAYVGRLQTDGMPVLEEAFARVKLG